MRPSPFSLTRCIISRLLVRWTLTNSINWRLKTKRELRRLRNATLTRKIALRPTKKLWQSWRNTGRPRNNLRTLRWVTLAMVVVWNQTLTWTLLWFRRLCLDKAKRNYLKKTAMLAVQDLHKLAAKPSKDEEFSHQDVKNLKLSSSVTWATSIFKTLSRASQIKRSNCLNPHSSTYLQKLRALKTQKSS